MIRINCDLGFCDQFSEYNIPDEELDDGTNASLIHFSVYIYQERCATNGKNSNRPSVCKICEENDDIKNFLIKRPTYGKKKHITKISFSISEFYNGALSTNDK